MRKPAQVDLNSSRLKWVAADPEIAAWLEPLNLRFRGGLQVAYSGAGGDSPAYVRVIADGAGEPRLFVKLMRQSSADHERNTAHLARNLVTRSVMTPAFDGEIVLSDGTHAFSYHWVEGRPPYFSVSDMRLLGESLAGLHAAMICESLNFEIASKTESRLSEFARFAVSPDFRAAWRGRSEEKFAILMRDSFLRDLDSMLVGAKPCHGDLNPGNIIVGNDGVAYFIDLEDALHTHVWPGLDLAKIIERVVLPASRVARSADLVASIKTLVDSYVAAGGQLECGFRLGSGKMARAMRWHLGLAVLIVTKNLGSAETWWEVEIEKFRQVDQLISSFNHIL
jgi:aminoglycoside phosphotransferase (APT) family kinase protein